MEFEEMKKIWDSQNNRPMYAIDNDALHQRIKAKKKGTKRVTSKIEWMLIGSNMFSGGLLLVTHSTKENSSLWALTLAVVMLVMAVAGFWARLERIKRDKQLDLSMLGDLDNALTNIKYRLRLSKLMLVYLVLIAGFVITGSILQEKPVWVTTGIIAFFIVGLWLSRWEYRSWHLPKRRELEAIKSKLINDLDIDYSEH